MLMEIGMDSHCHVVTDTHHSTESVGTQAQMSILTHILKALALLLHRIIGAAGAIDFNAFALNLTGLTLGGTFHKGADYTDAGTCRDEFQFLFANGSRVNDHLHVLDGRAIVEGNKVNGFGTAMRTHPAFHANFLAVFCVLQDINDFCSVHNMRPTPYPSLHGGESNDSDTDDEHYK